MKKVYLASAISDYDRKMGQIRTANEIRKLGFNVYAASENDNINDKSNNPTSADIYNADISKILNCDILVAKLTGAGEDGTLSEIGFTAGYNEHIFKTCEMLRNSNVHKKMFEGTNDTDNIVNDFKLIEEIIDKIYKPIPIIAYTSNERIMQPQIEDGIPSAHLNHLILGMIKENGIFVSSENEMLKILKEML